MFIKRMKIVITMICEKPSSSYFELSFIARLMVEVLSEIYFRSSAFVLPYFWLYSLHVIFLVNCCFLSVVRTELYPTFFCSEVDVGMLCQEKRANSIIFTIISKESHS